MKNILNYTSFVMAGLLLLTTSCIDENFDDSSDVGITDKDLLINVLNAENGSDELSLFLALVDANGLTGALTSRRTQDQLTVFAPTNTAFEIFAAEIGFNSVDDMLAADASDFEDAIFDAFEVETNLLEILENHISTANLTLAQIENGAFRKIGALSGVNIPVNREDGNLIINNDEDVEVLRSNTEGNGTVHIVSRVLLPVKFIEAISYDFGAESEACEEVLGDWTVVNVVLEGGSGWGCTNFGFEGQGIQANGFDDGAKEVDSWIITPALNDTELILNTVKFKYASRFDGPSPEVWAISEEDYDAAAAFDPEVWTDLEFNFPAPASGNGVFSDQAVAIPAEFHAEVYRFAFRYTSGAGAATRVTIDNIQIGEE